MKQASTRFWSKLHAQLKWNEVKKKTTTAFSSTVPFYVRHFCFGGRIFQKTLPLLEETQLSEEITFTSAIRHSVSDSVEQFALQSSPFSSSSSLWHLLSTLWFHHLLPSNTWRAILLEDSNKGTEGHIAAAGSILQWVLSRICGAELLRPDLWRVTVEFISIIHLAVQLPSLLWNKSC